MTFWIIALLLGLVVTALLARGVMRAREAATPAAAFDLQVYRDQLSEIERDAARGVIPSEEAERLRTEVSRRILAADAKARAAGANTGSKGSNAVLAGLMAVIVLGGGFGTYQMLGAPGYPDLPLAGRIAAAKEARENRPTQAQAEADLPPSPAAEATEEYATLVEKLREAVAQRPDDLRGHILLARSEAALGNYAQAYASLARIAELKGEDATAKDYADLADMMVIAAGGYVSPEAQKALEEALARDPRNGVARYYGGLMMAQTGRPDVAFRMWDQLLRESEPTAPWLDPIRAQIEELAFRAGISGYELPEAPRGPTQGDIAAAQDMSAEDRMEMIRGMVGQLSDRLANVGGTPQEWARLISSLMVLDEVDQARAIWAEAQERFAETPEALATIRGAAERAGILE
ncbi:c-type cytochrome biogenesis protein CcmI [Pacificoceanicola onchidii]|uniref:c-type cytochrome biogenesis protein CcmI n=1 Tax=Pacificoceanicola onchidii TaxID=2562685 RepID=UPI0010A44402|nr:c-type cytochrome biogenesis protein CcmI [Pacificoceanicola onchidii]